MTLIHTNNINVTHHYTTLIFNIRGMLSHQWCACIAHTLWEGNQCEDFFAIKGDEKDVVIAIYVFPPSTINLLLLADAVEIDFTRP